MSILHVLHVRTVRKSVSEGSDQTCRTPGFESINMTYDLKFNLGRTAIVPE